MLNQKKVLLITFILLFSWNLVFARDDGQSTYGYRNGIYGCGCFKHCKCFSHYIGDSDDPGAFPKDKSYHPAYSEDKVWHAFMNGILSAKKLAPYHDWNRSSFSNFIGSPELVTEYLDKIDSYYLLVETDRVNSINFHYNLYNKPKEEAKRTKIINDITSQAIAANHKLDETIQIIMPLYEQLVDSCPHHEEYNLALHYNRGMLKLFKGNAVEAADSIETLVVLAQKLGVSNLLKEKFFVDRCEVLLEVGMYHDAIETATKAIEKYPENKQLYFSRAFAYFETGQFDEALSDFHSADKKKDLSKAGHETSNEFRDALLTGLIKHTADGMMEFFPTLAHSAYGLTNSLWSFVKHPLDSSANFINACYEASKNVADYISSVNLETIEDSTLNIYQNYNNLSDAEKGDLLAYAIGKYGVDIFAGSTSLKCISSIKKLKQANAICNLEALSSSEATKQAVITNALRYRTERQRFFQMFKSIGIDKINISLANTILKLVEVL